MIKQIAKAVLGSLEQAVAYYAIDFIFAECDCYMEGTTSCTQATGRCICKPGWMGDKCQCKPKPKVNIIYQGLKDMASFHLLLIFDNLNGFKM